MWKSFSLKPVLSINSYVCRLKKKYWNYGKWPRQYSYFFSTRKLRGSNWTSKQPKAFSTTSECEELLHGKVEKRSFESFPYNNWPHLSSYCRAGHCSIIQVFFVLCIWKFCKVVNQLGDITRRIWGLGQILSWLLKKAVTHYTLCFTPCMIL